MDYNLLVAAKTEYTEKLQDILCETIYLEIKSIWKECNDSKSVRKLYDFQKKLCTIPLWNQEIINTKFKNIKIQSDVSDEYLDNIIEAVFLSNVKILSVVKINNVKQSIDVKIPDTKNFIHRCFIESARSFYKDPYLIDDRQSPSNNLHEIKRNVKRSLNMIKDDIEKTIRNMMPMEDILVKYLNAHSDESDGEVASLKSEVKPQEEEKVEEVYIHPEVQEDYEQYVTPQEEVNQNEYRSVDNLFEEKPEENPHEVHELHQQNETMEDKEKLVVDLKNEEKHFFSDTSD